MKILESDDIIARRIKIAINDRGYKDQQDFCIRSGAEPLPPPLISDIINGKRRTIENMIEIAHRLDCSLDYLVGIEPLMEHDANIKSMSKMMEYIINNLNYHHIVWWNWQTEQFELKGTRQELYHWLFNLRRMLNRKYRNKKSVDAST